MSPSPPPRSTAAAPRSWRSRSPGWPAPSVASPRAAPGTDEARVADAIRSHPEYLGGSRRDVTTFIQRTPGAIAKDGAEAVYAVGLADGRGIALKVADGGQRARTVILAAVLRRLGVESGAIDGPRGRARSSVTASRSAPSSPWASECGRVLQRVHRAAVVVEGETVGEITEPGCSSSSGSATTTARPRSSSIARKIADLRLLEGERSVTDAGAPVLVVSQFTLLADTRKGRRPSWNAAAPGDVAEPVVAQVVAALRERGLTVATGRFGAHMDIELVADGPVTIVVDTSAP